MRRRHEFVMVHHPGCDCLAAEAAVGRRVGAIEEVDIETGEGRLLIDVESVLQLAYDVYGEGVDGEAEAHADLWHLSVIMLALWKSRGQLEAVPGRFGTHLWELVPWWGDEGNEES